MNNEREVSIADLFWKVCLSWRGIIITAVICTLVFTGYSFYKYKQAQASFSDTYAEYEKQLEEYKSKQVEEKISEYSFIEPSESDLVGLTTEEAYAVNTAINYRKNLDKASEYIETSPLMNVNPYEEKRCSVTYAIEPDGSLTPEEAQKTVYTLERAYEEYVNSVEFVEFFKDEFAGYEEKYIAELISTRKDSVKTETTEIVPPQSTITVDIIIPEEINDVDVLTEVLSSLPDRQGQLGRTVAKHELKLLSGCVDRMVDSSLADRQRNYASYLATYRTGLTTAINGMSDAQLKLVFPEKRAAEDASKLMPAAPAKPGISKKYILLGFVLGVFLAAVFVACRMLFSSRLTNVSELNRNYKLRSIGTVQTGKKRKGFDRWLLSRQNRNEKQLDDKTRLDIACSNLELICAKEGIYRLVLTGTEIEKLEKETIEEITKRLKAKNVYVNVENNICYDMSSLRNAAEIGIAVLIETVSESKYNEIEKELSALKDNEVKVLGCIGAGSF